MGSQRVRHDWVTNAFTFFNLKIYIHFMSRELEGFQEGETVLKQDTLLLHHSGPCRSVPAAMDHTEAQPRGATLLPRSGRWPRVPGYYRAGVPKSREELPHVQGQGRWPGGTKLCPRPGAGPRGATPHPRRSGCMGAKGPRGATPRSRSRGAAMRRYSSSKVRSSGCALLEQL